MSNILSRLRQILALPVEEAPPAATPSESLHEQADPRLRKLEDAVQEQQQQMDQAVRLLQNAAFLAGYHQPPLERDIRSFLAQVKSPRNGELSAP